MGSCNSGGKGTSTMSSLSSDMRATLGRRGKPISPQDALKNTNPNYSKGRQWQVNCQRCVYAYELQRRGFDVEAQPKILNAPDPVASKWRSGFEGQRWETNLGRRNSVVEKTIESKMAGFGDGSRAIIYVAWKSGNSAHVFNVEQIAGKTRCFDAQTGREVKLSDYLSLSKPSATMLSRVDHLDTPKDMIKGAVKKR